MCSLPREVSPIIEAHRTGFDDFAAFLAAYSTERSGPECGL